MRQDIINAVDRQAVQTTIEALTRCIDTTDSVLARTAYATAREQLYLIELEWGKL